MLDKFHQVVGKKRVGEPLSTAGAGEAEGPASISPPLRGDCTAGVGTFEEPGSPLFVGAWDNSG